MKIEEKKKLVAEDEFRLQETEGLKSVVTIDELVEDYVGSFGFSQLLHVFFVSLAWIFDSQNTLVTIFTDARPEWRCKSHCANVTSHGKADSLCGLQPGSWEWIGGNASSTIAEWNLVCDRKFLAAVPASLFFLGSILGCALYGRLSDGFLGRKKTILLSCILTSATAFITSLSPNVWIYAVLRFANGFSRSGIGTCSLVLSTEVVGRKWRGQVGQYGFFFFTAGFLSLPLIAYPNRTSWRNIHRILSVLPLVYSIVVLPFVSESPRWLLIRGRNQEAVDVLKKFARFNGKKLPEDISLSNTSPPGEPLAETKKKTLWGTKWAAARMIMMMIAGVGVGFVYYGIQLNVENLNFNLYYTVALNAMMEIPAVFVGGVLLSFTNRRLLFSSSSYIAGAACLICAVLAYGSNRGKEDGASRSWSQLSVEAMGFMAASTAFDVSYIYCVELFPTNVRNFAVSMLRQALMFGASIAPLLVVAGRMSPAFSFLVFGAASVCSGLLSLWLPETRNAPLYETIEHQEKEESLDSVSHESEI